MELALRDPLVIYPPEESTFAGNGLRSLSPTIAEYTLEMNTAGSLHIEHPIDSDGDWKALIPGYLIIAYVPYRGEIRRQPFRIYRRTKRRSGNTLTIAVDALHWFYDLNYVLLEDVRPTNLNGQNAIQWLFDRPYDPYGQAASRLPLHNFEFSSDITDQASAEYQWKTMTGALIGEDNCVLTRWGGELFVNLNYFSINSVMEESKQDAFFISDGYNLQEIEESLDYTNTFSQLVATDNFGNNAHASIPLSSSGLPFEKTLHAAFNYPDDLGHAENGLRFGNDFSKYMSTIQTVEASYSVKHRDIADNDPFQELANYEVGDTGTIEDTELEISTTQRITKVVIDLLTGERILTETGSVKRSIARKTAYSNTVSTSESAQQKAIEALTEQVGEIERSSLATWATARSMTWGTAKKYKWSDGGARV